MYVSACPFFVKIVWNQNINAFITKYYMLLRQYMKTDIKESIGPTVIQYASIKMFTDVIYMIIFPSLSHGYVKVLLNHYIY